jgi:hypothetical protein
VSCHKVSSQIALILDRLKAAISLGVTLPNYWLKDV